MLLDLLFVFLFSAVANPALAGSERRKSFSMLHHFVSQSLGFERAARQIGIDAGHGIKLGEVNLAGQLFQEM
jgi:hypothetical protein